MTSVLPGSGCSSAVAGVICWTWVAAIGFQATACFGVVGATDGCAVGAVGACHTVSEVEVVVMSCLATSTLVCMSGLIASG